LGCPGSSELTRKPNFADCSGIGFIAGARSKISVLDVDTTDERVLADALNRHGQMPLVVRTASGKWPAYYRHNGEPRRIPPWPDRPIDLIGGGLAVAPPTSTARGSYEIVTGNLDEFDRLPVMRGVEQVGRPPVGTGESISDGERNEKLFRWCLQQARYCDDLDVLLDVARRRKENLLPPLPEEEVMRVATSAWSSDDAALTAAASMGSGRLRSRWSSSSAMQMRLSRCLPARPQRPGEHLHHRQWTRRDPGWPRK
jgi:Primase C terminal 1 (PriCT-1)